MASSMTVFNSYKKYLRDGTIDAAENTIKVMLVTSDYEFNATHDVLADVQGSPDPEVEAIASPDNGYVTGGKALTGQLLTRTDSPNQSKFDADDVTWTALTAVFRGAIMYANVTVGGIVNPLMYYILFDTTPADISISGIDYKIQWSANGIDTLA